MKKRCYLVLVLSLLLLGLCISGCKDMQIPIQPEPEVSVVEDEKTIEFSMEIDIDELRSFYFQLGDKGKTGKLIEPKGHKFTAYAVFGYRGMADGRFKTVRCEFEHTGEGTKYQLTEINNRRTRNVNISKSEAEAHDWFVCLLKTNTNPGSNGLLNVLDFQENIIERDGDTDMPVTRKDAEGQADKQPKIDLDGRPFATPWAKINKVELLGAIMATDQSKATFSLPRGMKLQPLGYYMSLTFMNEIPDAATYTIHEVSIRTKDLRLGVDYMLDPATIAEGALIQPQDDRADGLTGTFLSDDKQIVLQNPVTIPQGGKSSFFFLYMTPIAPDAQPSFKVSVAGVSTPSDKGKAWYNFPEVSLPSLSSNKANHGKAVGYRMKLGRDPEGDYYIPPHGDVLNPFDALTRTYVKSNYSSGNTLQELPYDNWQGVNGIGPRHLISSDAGRHWKPNNMKLLTGTWGATPQAEPNNRHIPSINDWMALLPVYDSDPTSQKFLKDYEDINNRWANDWFNIKLPSNVGELTRKIVREQKHLTAEERRSTQQLAGNTHFLLQSNQAMEVVRFHKVDGSKHNVIMGAEYMFYVRNDQTKYPRNVVYGKRFIGGYDVNGFTAVNAVTGDDLNKSSDYPNPPGRENYLRKTFPKNSQLSAWRYAMRDVSSSSNGMGLEVEMQYAYLGPDGAGIPIETIADETWWQKKRQENKVQIVTLRLPRFQPTVRAIPHLTQTLVDDNTGLAYFVDRGRIWKEPIRNVTTNSDTQYYLRLARTPAENETPGNHIGQ